MWKDPIVEETRSRREELAQRFNHDVKTIGEELRRRRKTSGQEPFTRPPKRVKPAAARQALQSTADPLRGLSAAELGRQAVHCANGIGYVVPENP